MIAISLYLCVLTEARAWIPASLTQDPTSPRLIGVWDRLKPAGIIFSNLNSDENNGANKPILSLSRALVLPSNLLIELTVTSTLTLTLNRVNGPRTKTC
eukprot:549832-Amorphochlora_amoeboformis.AAC.1